ncbi:hypothetical protein GCM10023231_23170 [Olivibacter ginsenosidimutans]|uniref:UspA domain-containing protein n=1 Tax=Olivibacter ginsenosidimutans TaxID=1176537 RepID=A0ABP9BHN0_9SPHI
MKTLLVLTDFSDAATHAAKYATIFAKQLMASRIILFNKLSKIDAIPGTPLLVDSAYQSREEAMRQLKRLFHELKFLKHTHTELSYLVKEGKLEELTNELITKYQVDYVVMGLTGKSRLEQTLIGSNTIKIAKTVAKPLLIVPESSKLIPVSKIASISSLFDLKQAQLIHHLLHPLRQHDTTIELFVLHHENETHIQQGLHNHSLAAVKEQLAPYHPTYVTIGEIDIVRDVLDFCRDQQISLIVHIEKKRNFFESIFSTDITEQIAYVSHVPVLLAKQG